MFSGKALRTGMRGDFTLMRMDLEVMVEKTGVVQRVRSARDHMLREPKRRARWKWTRDNLKNLLFVAFEMVVQEIEVCQSSLYTIFSHLER